MHGHTIIAIALAITCTLVKYNFCLNRVYRIAEGTADRTDMRNPCGTHISMSDMRKPCGTHISMSARYVVVPAIP